VKYLAQGSTVRLPGAPKDAPHGVVVEVRSAPFPSLDLDASEMEQKTQVNVWKGLPHQVLVCWPNERGYHRVDWHLSDQLEHSDPSLVYRPGQGEFFLFAVETGGYGDLTAYYGSGEQAAAVFSGSAPYEPEMYRNALHKLVDAYLDDQQRRQGESVAAPANETVAATKSI
jgi:hypothetical protein